MIGQSTLILCSADVCRLVQNALNRDSLSHRWSVLEVSPVQLPSGMFYSFKLLLPIESEGVDNEDVSADVVA